CQGYMYYHVIVSIKIYFDRYNNGHLGDTMPTFNQVVYHVKIHVLWNDEYFVRFNRLYPDLVQ
ncbi:hypothetical protein AIZ11_24880, partial [Salmonella enterica subsp. enterica serovar Typhimurium]